MKKRKSVYWLYGFLILLIVGTGLLFVQNEFEKAEKTKEEKAYYPELRDQYNGYGLTDHIFGGSVGICGKCRMHVTIP